MATRKRAEMVNKLTDKMKFQLITMVQEEYATSMLSDTGFAEQAGKKLGFPVTEHNVASAREVVGIPSRREVRRGETNYDDLVARVTRLELVVSRLVKS